MIRIRGEYYDKELELDDLYYGKTIYGWDFVCESTFVLRESLKRVGVLEGQIGLGDKDNV